MIWMQILTWMMRMKNKKKALNKEPFLWFFTKKISKLLGMECQDGGITLFYADDR